MLFACRCDRDAMVFQHRAVRSNREGSRGCGSVGRASPCQGEGRGFESRHPLRGAGSAEPQHSHGGLAERLGTGLQSRLHRFESGTHLGRLAQRERASLTRKRSLVRSQYRPPRPRSNPVFLHMRNPVFLHMRPDAETPGRSKPADLLRARFPEADLATFLSRAFQTS